MSKNAVTLAWCLCCFMQASTPMFVRASLVLRSRSVLLGN
jgi:hypothetical protein